MTSFRFIISSPETTIFDGNITSLVVPTQEGYAGVLAHHAPFVALLGKGTITFTNENGTQTTLPSQPNSVIEVSHNRATIVLTPTGTTDVPVG